MACFISKPILLFISPSTTREKFSIPLFLPTLSVENPPQDPQISDARITELGLEYRQTINSLAVISQKQRYSFKIFISYYVFTLKRNTLNRTNSLLLLSSFNRFSVYKIHYEFPGLAQGQWNLLYQHTYKISSSGQLLVTFLSNSPTHCQPYLFAIVPSLITFILPHSWLLFTLTDLKYLRIFLLY